jgi:hypothetical protein
MMIIQNNEIELTSAELVSELLQSADLRSEEKSVRSQIAMEPELIGLTPASEIEINDL